MKVYSVKSWARWPTTQGADMRLKFSGRRERVSFRADYMLVGQFGDSLGVGENL